MGLKFTIFKTCPTNIEVVHVGSWVSCELFLKNINVSVDQVVMNNHPIYKIEENETT